MQYTKIRDKQPTVPQDKVFWTYIGMAALMVK